MSGRLDGRLVGPGVSGPIAAHQAAELLRLLRSEGADVQVLLTQSATRFVAPLTLAALSGHPVDDDVTRLLPDGRIGHVVIADSADALLVAPATAHWLGAMASGLAADPVTAACLATSAPGIVAPAMARSSIVVMSSCTRRPFGKPARSPPRMPRMFWLAAGGIATFSRRRSACVVPVKFWKPGMMPPGIPVSKIARRSARSAV